MKNYFLWGLVVALMTFSGSAQAVSPEEAEQKAQEINRLVESDVIYSQEASKALYYQNIQIISLLGEIRDLLKENLEKKIQTTPV